MMRKIFIAFCCLISAHLMAQQGKDGSPTITTTVEVNEYTYLTANEAAGSTTITVANSSLNTHGRFSGNLAAGDLVMIIQVQGAHLNGVAFNFQPNWGAPNDSSWGTINNYFNCGNYEFAEVNSVPSGTTIKLDCPLQYSYTDTGKVEVVRVPRYGSLTVNSPGIITCDPWDSTIGGIVAVEVQNNTTINSGGSMNATGLGFRGGSAWNSYSDSSIYGSLNFATILMSYGKEKGESVAGFEWGYDKYWGRYCEGAPGNGGGGGNAHNAGGGGGANGGVVANYINGYGNPDNSTNNYKTAWALEDSWLSTFTSSGGGRGGYSFSSNVHNPLTTGPNNSSWGGDDRRSTGGRGGRPLNYSTGRLFMAGGGGAGDQDNQFGGAGGNGGGMIFLMSYGTVSGAGQIIANGANGGNAQGTANGSNHNAGIDAAGGAGAGGTIIVNSVGNISGLTCTANGGTGGNQVITNYLFYTTNEAEGPGGGGGGGYIGTSNLGLTETATGGASGTTNAGGMVNFPMNGATIGGAGTTNAGITNFYITAKNDTICSGQTATLTATLNGTVPGGTSIEWFTTATGGSAIATGASYTTPPLTTNTTYYVGSCPGTYRIAVTVVISGSASVTISPNKSICKGSSDSLKATGGTVYAWTPTTGLSNASIANPIATPTATTTYSCSITTPCGIIKDTVKVTVLPLPIATITASVNPVCAGTPTTLTAGGGTVYTWSTGATTSSITVSPITTTTYTASVSNGACAKDTTIKITVNPLPTPTIGATTNPICPGVSTTISVTGGTGFTWSTSATTSSITVSPASTTTYTVGVSNGTCTKDTSITITVNTKPTVTVNPSAPTICGGGSVTLNGVGASTYMWSTSTGLSCTSCVATIATPTATTTYTVIGTSALGCADTTTVTVTVSTKPIVTFSPPSPTICTGNSVGITASGANSYTWAPATGLTCTNCPNPTASPTATTTYTVIGTSLSGCKDTTTITVTVASTLTATITPPSDSVCLGSSTTLTAGGGSTYLWSNSATTAVISVNPMVNTTYSVVVSSGGCKDSTSVLVKVNSLPVVTISNDTSVCAGTNVTLNVSGGGTYLWSNTSTSSSISVAPVNTTTYTAQVTSAKGCVKEDSVVITIIPKPTLTITPTVISCQGTADTLTVSGGGGYLWSNGATTSTIIVNPASSKIYTVTTGGGGPCPVSAVDTVKVHALPSVTLQGTFQICTGDSANLVATGGGTYLWTPGGNTSGSIIVTPSSTTVYTVAVTKNGCTKDTTLTETVNPLPVPSVNPAIITICKGETANLNASGGSTYLWSPAGSLNDSSIYDPIAKPLTNTNYTVIVSNGAGCEAKDSVNVIVTPGASGGACCSATIAPGGSESLTIAGAASGSTYKWSPSSSLSCDTCTNPTATPTVTTWYYVTITDGNGCSVLDSVLITVNESGCGDVFVPNAFSPGQKVNNILYVRGDCISSMEFDIFDRWGNKVFTSSNIIYGWDGTYSGKDMNMGTYVYFLKANLIDGTTVNKKGNITLVR